MSIDVYMQSQLQSPVGRLTAQNVRHVFSYDRDTVSAISLTMPLRHESYVHENGLHPIFQMNLPEGALRTAIERATSKLYGSDDLSVLAVLGAHQIGRLAYAQEKERPVATTKHNLDLHSMLKRNDANLFSELLDRFATLSGVAGVQPKVLINFPKRVTASSDQVSLPFSDKSISYDGRVTVPFDRYIVKSWGEEYPHLACNEFFCLKVAQESGLSIPNFYLSDNAQLLVSQRFDVDDMGSALGFEDFCVLQGKTTKQKYDASLESCANTIRHFVSPEYQHQALYDFYKLCYLNIILRNGDAHLKNIGVLYADLQQYNVGTVPLALRRLSPFFDLVSTVPYIKSDIMALSLTGSKRWPKPKVLYTFGRQHCLLNMKQIHKIEKEVKVAILSTMPLLEYLQHKHLDFTPIAESMKETILNALEKWEQQH